ncbi:SfnB family sulfur acquisition oxidoreductase [Microbispora sp. ATCC PTA-5024]|uniref:SfnB family sulfur acquisition oxidoreductase n=1 Tax=Microbispora sp. ATCC PTA-5024 TaxID=316330 RepID=UPI0022B670F0|nr:SfnB family sulfur acquisition oxidoreductase [Microbispora sp. ATCC PTA-5024]
MGVSVPREHAGAEVGAATLAEVFRLLATGDPNIAQIPQSHFVYVNVLRAQGSPEQKRFFFGEVLAGRRFGNAQSEAGTRHVQDYRTRLTPAPDGGHVLTGEKHYSTGALFADWIPVLARDADELLQVAYVPRDAPGVEVIDDWAGMGQRVTASGTVRLREVRVPAAHVVPHHLTFTGPHLHGALAQLLHAAIDVGIAGAALRDAREFVLTKSRPWFESGSATAAEDPLLIQRFGELAVTLRAAQALLREAGRAVDDARAVLAAHDAHDAAAGAGPGAADDREAAEAAGAASISVATAKAYADRAAIELADAVFEVSGTRSSLEGLNLNRHWRNARTHTLHDPVRWKVQHIGRYTLNGTLPPRHGLL